MTADSIVSKIQKLLKLAGESNPNSEEAGAALAKAQQLMLLHEIEVLDLKEKPEPDEFTKEFVGAPYDRAPGWEGFVSQLLQDHFHVRVVRSRVFMPGGKVPFSFGGDSKVIDIPKYAGMPEAEYAIQLIGRKSHVLIGEYVYEFLGWEFERLWAQHRHETGKGAYARLDFFEGLYHGLNQRLKDERRRDERTIPPEQNNQFALMKADEDKQLNAYLHQEFPHLRKGARRYREMGDVDSYQAGKRSGQDLNIRPAINSAKGTKLLN
jgi:hypothetical protein